MESEALLWRARVCHSAMLLSWAAAKQRRPQLHTLAAGSVKKAAGLNEPAAFRFAELSGGSANPACAPVEVKAAYLNLTVVLKCLPSRIITSSSRQVPAQALLVDQL